MTRYVLFKYIFGGEINLVQRYENVVLNTSLYQTFRKYQTAYRIRLEFFNKLYYSVLGSNSGVFFPKFFTYFYLNLVFGKKKLLVFSAMEV